MTVRTSIRLAGALALAALAAVGCGRTTGDLRPWPPITDPVVFQDTFTGVVNFEAFGNSKYDALSTDATEQHEGTGCVRVTVPNAGSYAGGAFVAIKDRDLTAYNALTFWAKASKSVTMDVAGFGNNNAGTSRFEAKRTAIGPITPTWQKFVIPIPAPGKLTEERGLFFFAAAPQLGAGYVLWFDDVRFETVGAITNPRPAMANQTLDTFVGAAVGIQGTSVTFNVNGTNQFIQCMPGYLSYASSNPAVATVDGGVIHVVGSGTSTITARLGTTDATGSVTVNATAPPAVAAPSPTLPAAAVLSLFSNTYNNVPVDTWSAGWDVADVSDVKIAGNDVKLYTNLVYAGIEFTTHTIDASAMTHFHMDVWAPTGSVFRVKLVDFGANGVYGGGDDSEQDLPFTDASTPPFATGTWVGLEIPLANFTNLLSRGHLAQLIIAGDTKTVYVDNAYFHR